MEHGAAFNPEQVVEVTAVRTGRAMVFYVRDPGAGFRRESLNHAAIVAFSKISRKACIISCRVSSGNRALNSFAKVMRRSAVMRRQFTRTDTQPGLADRICISSSPWQIRLRIQRPILCGGKRKECAREDTVFLWLVALWMS